MCISSSCPIFILCNPSGGGATQSLPRDGGVEEFHGDPIPTVGPRLKVWTRGQKWKMWCRRWRAGEARMRDNPEGDELDPAEGVRRRCKKNFSSVFSCISKRTREDCDRDSKIGTVHSG